MITKGINIFSIIAVTSATTTHLPMTSPLATETIKATAIQTKWWILVTMEVMTQWIVAVTRLLMEIMRSNG